jgi:hypothetical protein
MGIEVRAEKSLISSILLSLILSLISVPAHAAVNNVTATGTSPTICNQSVGDPTNVTAQRLSGGDCVISFKNVGTTTWTVPTGITSAWILVVGGGGGGASRHAGGGGAGGVVEATSYPVSGTVGVLVGGGGSAGLAASNGTSGTNSRFFANAEATSGSTGLLAQGGGFGGFYTQIDSYNIARAGAGGSGGGTGVPSPFTRDLITPYGNIYSNGLTTQSSVTQKNLGGSALSSNFAQYGNDGAQGGESTYWAGGGGGGAGTAGNRGGSATGINRSGGSGGAGLAFLITGTSTYFGGGGGGGAGVDSSGNLGSAGAGGSGGGGAGSVGNNTATVGTANTGGGGGGGGLTFSGANGPGAAGGSGIVIVRYTPDVTAPTFASSTFSAAENIATSATAATIRVSESATVTISSGADSALFNISRSDTDTAIIKFNASPNYEAPTDSGANNVYDLTLTATDTAGNAGAQSITITVTDVVDTSSFNSLALAGSATTAAFRTSVLITANVSVASKVTFTINGKVLPGCKNRTASGSGSSFSATCNWKPSRRGDVTLTASAAPTGAGISSATAPQLNIRVGNRTGAR